MVTRHRYSMVMLMLPIAGCGGSDPPPKPVLSRKPISLKINAEQAVRVAEAFIRSNGYTDRAVEEMSNLDVDIPELMAEEDAAELDTFLALRRNSLLPRAYGWRRGRRNDPNGWTVGFERVGPLASPSIGQAVEMDEYGMEVHVERMGFNLTLLSHKL
jgi:hypothetical protein